MHSNRALGLLLAVLTGGALAQSTAAPAAGASAAPAAGGAAAGGKADPQALKGFQTWRAAACDRCHGASQEGSVGPSLIDGMKRLSKDQFADIVGNGRLAKNMPAYKTNNDVMQNMDALYAYLKGRADGSIPNAKVEGPSSK